MKNLVESIINAYVSVMGVDKWNSLTAEQQHDVIMTIAKDLNAALDRA